MRSSLSPSAAGRLLIVAMLFASAVLFACAPAEESILSSPEPEPVEVVDTITVGGTATAPDGVEIAYSTRGTGSPALVLLHCWSCDRSFWRHQMETFGSDHQVVAIDLGGHGESGSERTAWTLEGLGEDAVAVIEKLGIERAIVVGHSMGAPVALEVAQRLPEAVEGVILIDSLHDVEEEPQPEEWKSMMSAYRKDFAGTCGQMIAAMFPQGSDPMLVADVEGTMCGGSPEIGIALLEAFPKYDAAAEIAEIKVPVRAINAEMLPTDIESNRRHALDYDAQVMPGVGHFPMLEQPEEFNRRLAVAIGEIESAGGG